MKADDIKVIGITGGIGSGKSTFADFIRQEGYPVIDMDSRAKELMSTSAEVQKKIIAAFGEVAYQNGVLNKDFLAQKVFATTQEGGENLQKLNSIVHPAAIDDKIKEIERLSGEGHSMIFVESALIFEAGLADGYDYIITVNAPKERRIEFLKKNREMTEEQILARMSQQLSDEEKSREADFTVDNKSDMEALKTSALFMVSLLENMPGKDFNQLST